VATRTNKTFYIILGNISHLAGTSTPPENPAPEYFPFLSCFPTPFFSSVRFGSVLFLSFHPSECPSVCCSFRHHLASGGGAFIFRWWLGGSGWVVVFIFATCEKNTLEHIKLRMLKMLYGFSVRFISILYVLFIYIRLCQPFHQMCLASPRFLGLWG